MKFFLEVVGISLIAAAIGSSIIALIGYGDPSSEPFKCKGGYMFVKSSGYQLISENGGGIKCEEKK